MPVRKYETHVKVGTLNLERSFYKMDTNEVNTVVSYKIYLIYPNVSEPEIRRFGILGPILNYSTFTKKLTEVCPRLSEKSFLIYWKDDEGDEVAVSSSEELRIAHLSMRTDVKKFIVKVEGLSSEKRNKALHPHIYCDGCECGIVGFRYKCILCRDYDLCENCEKAEVHADHPMLRIPDSRLYKRESLQKMIHIMESVVSRDKHRERKHFHEAPFTDGAYPESPKKHKKCERHESGDTDESEDGCHRKHSHFHKKLKKEKCLYSQMMNDVFAYLSPKYFQMKAPQGWPDETKEGAAEEYSHAKYLRSVGMTLQKFLDPLGVEVDFEVRPNGAKKEEKKREEQENGTPPPTPSAPRPSSSQKEVRFADSQEMTKQKIDEIAKLLSKQTVQDNSKNDDNDGWVEFEELEKGSGDSRQTSSTGTIPKAPQQQENKQPETSKSQENQTLYPNLSPGQLPADPVVRNALEKMLAMGFTNEGNWLTQLLEAKGGNIDHALEVLDPHNKESYHRP